MTILQKENLERRFKLLYLLALNADIKVFLKKMDLLERMIYAENPHAEKSLEYLEDKMIGVMEASKEDEYSLEVFNNINAN